MGNARMEGGTLSGLTLSVMPMGEGGIPYEGKMAAAVVT